MSTAAPLDEVPQLPVEDEPESPLQEAIRDAQMTLDHCIRNGVAVDPAVARTIIQASRGEITNAEQEASFWLAFGALAAAARPATIDGLRQAEPGEGLSTRKYRVWAWIALVLLVLFQVDWLIGSKLLTDINDLDTNLKQQNETIASRTQAAGDNAASDPQLQALEASREETFNKLHARVQLLNRWNSFNVFARVFSVEVKSDQLAQEQAADFQIRVLQLYILPLLYGWLGASIYILRNVSRQIVEKSYCAAAHRIYQLREAMGALAGLAIAWVIGDTVGVSVSTISPFALAFVAGYSVDILFTGIDKIVAAFSAAK